MNDEELTELADQISAAFDWGYDYPTTLTLEKLKLVRDSTRHECSRVCDHIREDYLNNRDMVSAEAARVCRDRIREGGG